MNEPRHIYGAGEWVGGKWSGQYDDERVVGDRRYTLTEGEEWDVLMLRVRGGLTDYYDGEGERHAAAALRDFLAYFGEQA